MECYITSVKTESENSWIHVTSNPYSVFIEEYIDCNSDVWVGKDFFSTHKKNF